MAEWLGRWKLYWNFTRSKVRSPAETSLYFMFLFHIIFFYLTTFIANKLRYISHYLSFLKYLEMTKVKILYGSPSKFYCSFSLTDLLKLSEILDFGLCNALQLGITVNNRIRTTILYLKNRICKSHKVRTIENNPIYLVKFEFFVVYLDIKKLFFNYDTLILDALKMDIRISKTL